MSIEKNLYKDDSIISLDPREFTRLRPSTYLGSNEYSTQLVREVFANSLDEHCIGHGNLITVSINSTTNTYIVEDHAQGFPINIIRDDNETVLQASFDVLNTSGKYDDSKEGVYNGSSLGCNGIGAKLTNFLSSWLEVISYDGKQYEHLWFKDGIFEKRDVGKWQNGTTGTLVQWSPDPQFFQNKEANISELKKLFEDISALCPSLVIELIVDNKKTVYQSKNGISDLITSKVKDKEILSSRFSTRKEVDENLFDISLTYTSDYSENIIPYVNYGLTESGIHIGVLKAALAYQINKYAHENKILKKDDYLLQTELAEGSFIVFNIKTTNVKYDSQTKSKIVDFNKQIMVDVISNEFVDWLNNNPKDAKTIISKALTARKAREAAQKAKDGIRNAGVKNKKFISLPTKLVDAYTKKRDEAVLYIVEGDSAMNGLVAKRDGKTQAIFPIRGKILNCQKATTDKIYGNAEISNIVKAIGLDIDKTTGKLIYDEKKLRYGNIFIATDADEDGFQIRLLLINMFWCLCPELVTAGKLWAVVPPLFRITNKKNEYIYLKDHEELAQYNKKHKSESFDVGRLKGLGEMSPEEAKYCLLDPATRHVEQIIVNNTKLADELLDTFMNTSVDPRRDYLLKHINEVQND